MVEYEYLSKKRTIPDSPEILEELSDYPVVAVRSDREAGRVFVGTDEPLDEDEKEEVDEIVRELIKDVEEERAS